MGDLRLHWEVRDGSFVGRDLSSVVWGSGRGAELGGCKNVEKREEEDRWTGSETGRTKEGEGGLWYCRDGVESVDTSSSPSPSYSW